MVEKQEEVNMELYCIRKAEEADAMGNSRNAEFWYMRAAIYGRHDVMPRKTLKRKKGNE